MTHPLNISLNDFGVRW